MTEAEWLACADRQKMLEFLFTHPGYSERKMRLFAVACYWQVEEFHWDEPLFDVEVEAVERYADGLIGRDDLLAASLAHYRQLFPGEEESALRFVSEEADYAAWMADWAAQRARYAGDGAWPAGAAEAGQADLLRDLFGNPFRPLSIDPSWLTWKDGTIPRLAQAIYEDRDFPFGHLDRDRMAVLGGALEDAGCSDPDLLGHCRGPGPHVRGCWVVDLILEKV
jgi:hypothetical protein